MLIIAFWAICFSGIIQAQQSFTLNEAVQYALTNSNDIKLAQKDVEDADSQVVEYRSIGLPHLDASANYQYYFEVPVQPVADFLTPSIYGVLSQEFDEIDPFTGEPDVFEFSFFLRNNLSGNLDASWLLFDGSFLTGLKAAKLFKELTRKGVEVKEEEIKAQVTKAYMNILIALENKDILSDNIKNIERALRETKAYYENGFMEKLDVDRLELSLENVQTEFEKVDQLIDLGYNLLKFQMNYPLSDEIIITEDLQTLVDRFSIENVDLEEAIDFNKRAQYNEILMGQQLNDLDIERLKKAYLPNLMARANYNQSLLRDDLFDGNEAGWIPAASVSLALNIPIFDGLEKKGKIQRAKIRKDKTEIQKQDFERAISLEVMNARLNYTNAKKTLVNRRRSLDIINDIYDKTLIKFNEGVGSSVEVTQAENQLYDSQANYIRALYDLLISKTDLDIALGNL